MDDSGSDDVIVNLKSIADTQVNDKLCIIGNGKYIVRDERVFQFVFRHITGDGRLRVIEFMEKLMLDIRHRLDTETGWKRDKIVNLLPAVINGMKKMRFTYCMDRIVLFRLENLIDTLYNINVEISGNKSDDNDDAIELG